MSVVTLKIAGYAYKIACQDGQENRILELAGYLDEKATKLKNSIGYIPENQLLAMVSVLVAQELFALRQEKASNTSATIDKAQIDIIENLSTKVLELATLLKKE
ncbi:MAG: cell division protein ZapA [Alphaproteobacteria bacterium]|nr:cell division protein ZapA [Alphaproteobacteria bacterium]